MENYVKIAFWGVSSRSGVSANMMAVAGIFCALHPEIRVIMREAVRCGGELRDMPLQAWEGDGTVGDNRPYGMAKAGPEAACGRPSGKSKPRPEAAGRRPYGMAKAGMETAWGGPEVACGGPSGKSKPSPETMDGKHGGMGKPKSEAARGKLCGKPKPEVVGKRIAHGRAGISTRMPEGRAGGAARRAAEIGTKAGIRAEAGKPSKAQGWKAREAARKTICFFDCGSGFDALRRHILGQMDIVVANVRPDEEELKRFFLEEAHLMPGSLVLIGDYCGQFGISRHYLERIYRADPERLFLIPRSYEFDYACERGRARDFLKKEGRDPKSLRSSQFFAELEKVSVTLLNSPQLCGGSLHRVG